MDSFSLLKYWGGGGAANMRTTTIAASVLRPSVETDDDEGPFFDLEFAVPDEDSGDGGENRDDSTADSDEEEEERELKFEVSSDANTNGGGHCASSLEVSSPSDDLFFKGGLLPLEPSSLVVATAEADSKPPFPVSLLNSATKLRVFILGFRKPKSAAAESTGAEAASPKQQQQSKFFIRFKVEEVPIVSLFARYGHSSTTGRAARPRAEDTAAEEKRFSTEVVQKYLDKIKPLYVRVSKRYGEKLRFSGLLNFDGVVGKAGPVLRDRAAPSCGDKSQRAIVPAGLRVACQRLGNSRSASAAVAAAPPPPVVQRRDDSLLQQEDGIRSAIAHCKRSFNADED